MRAESDIRTATSSGSHGGKTAVLSSKMMAAMAKMMAAAKAAKAKTAKAKTGRSRTRRVDASLRFKAALSPNRWRRRAGRWLPASFVPKTAVVLPDPSPRVVDAEAKLVADALMRLAPAIGRAAVYGTPVKVTVADRHTADVFREALSRTGRSTDRLVQVVYDA